MYYILNATVYVGHFTSVNFEAEKVTSWCLRVLWMYKCQYALYQALRMDFRILNRKTAEVIFEY